MPLIFIACQSSRFSFPRLTGREVLLSTSWALKNVAQVSKHLGIHWWGVSYLKSFHSAVTSSSYIWPPTGPCKFPLSASPWPWYIIALRFCLSSTLCWNIRRSSLLALPLDEGHVCVYSCTCVYMFIWCVCVGVLASACRCLKAWSQPPLLSLGPGISVA